MEVWQDQWTVGRRKSLGGKKNKNEVINATVCLVMRITSNLKAESREDAKENVLKKPIPSLNKAVPT